MSTLVGRYIQDYDQCLSSSASSFFRGLAAAKQNNVAAESLLLDALETDHYSFAMRGLLEFWVRDEDWGKIMRFLESSAPINRLEFGYFLTGPAFSHIVDAQGDEIDRWINILTVREPSRILFFAEELLKAQKFKSAEVWARKLVDTDAATQALLIAGSSLFYRQEYQQALDVFDVARSQDQNSADAAYWYGRTLLYLGKGEEAIPPLEAAVTLATEPYLPWYLAELSRAYIVSYRCGDALATIDKAFSKVVDQTIVPQLEAIKVAAVECISN